MDFAALHGPAEMEDRARACVCVCVCGRPSVRACVRACVGGSGQPSDPLNFQTTRRNASRRRESTQTERVGRGREIHSQKKRKKKGQGVVRVEALRVVAMETTNTVRRCAPGCSAMRERMYCAVLLYTPPSCDGGNVMGTRVPLVVTAEGRLSVHRGFDSVRAAPNVGGTGAGVVT